MLYEVITVEAGLFAHADALLQIHLLADIDHRCRFPDQRELHARVPAVEQVHDALVIAPSGRARERPLEYNIVGKTLLVESYNFV